MSEKKIVVPEGMLKAAMESSCQSQYGGVRVKESLEAALRWLSEELEKSDGLAPMLNGTYQDGWRAAWRHIGRMFVRSVPEVDHRLDLMFRAAANAPEGVDRIDIFSGNVLLESRPIAGIEETFDDGPWVDPAEPEPIKFKIEIPHAGTWHVKLDGSVTEIVGEVDIGQ